MSQQTHGASVADVDDLASQLGESGDQLVRDRREMDGLREKAALMVGDVNGWLKSVEEEGSGRSGSGNSEVSEGDVATTTAVAYAVTGLQEFAKRVQRISKQRLLRRFRKGRTAVVAERRGGLSRMKQYSLSGARTLLDLEKADGIYDELNAEKRVVSQIVARTAIGKTTRFPALLASRTKRRVLLLEPDVPLARYAAEAQKGQVAVRTPWQRSRVPVLTTMSYEDFIGHFKGQNGLEMLSQFDVAVFDEAGVVDAKTEAAKTLAATYAKDTSLLVMSATMEGDDVQATGRPVDVRYTANPLVDLAERGQLMKGVCGKDRTLVIATDDREAHLVGEHINAGGYDVRVLDSASKLEEIKFANEFLKEESSVVKRFLVVTPEYGMGYNFYSGNLITSGKKRVNVMSEDGTVLESRTVVCSQSEIKQQVGRVNRGMTAGATALVCVPPEHVKEDGELSVAERLRYYVMMIASHVTPTRELTESVKGLLPFGLTQRVAEDVLAINLPVEVAIRFFAEDGRVPFKYVDALAAFSEVDHDFMVSEHDEPYGRERWFAEPMSGYYDEVDKNMPAVEVPCHSSGEIKVVLHAVSAAAVGLLTVDNWQPRMYDSDVSDDDVRPQSRRSEKYMPRLITESSPVRRKVTAVVPYSYDVPAERQFAPRSRMAIQSREYPGEVLRDLATLDVDVNRNDFSISCEISEFREGGSERIGILHRPKEATPIDVHSPGGSVVMAFRKVVWEKLVAGEVLDPVDARSFFHSIKNNVEGFVQSDAFSGWTDVWLAILRTAGDAENIRVVRDNNYTTRVITLIFALVVRYTTAVKQVSKQSVIKASFLQSMMSQSTSYESLYKKQSSRGRVELAQSESFLRRVFMIRDEMVVTLTNMESAGIFLPAVVTQLQQMLPVMQKTGHKLYDKPAFSSRYRKVI